MTARTHERMPVTARLSQKFYEKLGEDIANELVDWFNSVDATYRADLRELNELNFSRFEAKLGERLAELRVDMTKLEAQFDKGLDRLKTELLRWLFGFWVSTLLGLGALFFRG